MNSFANATVVVHAGNILKYQSMKIHQLLHDFHFHRPGSRNVFAVGCGLFLLGG